MYAHTFALTSNQEKSANTEKELLLPKQVNKPIIMLKLVGVKFLYHGLSTILGDLVGLDGHFWIGYHTKCRKMGASRLEMGIILAEKK